MHLCVLDATVNGAQVVNAQDGVSCASLGFADYYGPMAGYPPLTLGEIDSLFGVSLTLWVTCFMLRLIRRLIPKGIG